MGTLISHSNLISFLWAAVEIAVEDELWSLFGLDSLLALAGVAAHSAEIQIQLLLVGILHQVADWVAAAGDVGRQDRSSGVAGVGCGGLRWVGVGVQASCDKPLGLASFARQQVVVV